MIGGFIVTGNDSKRVVVRGIGPSLEGAGVQGVIADPVLRLFRSNGTEFAFNDNWTDTQGADLQTIGLAPTHPFESAIVATLDPGAYTTIVSGKGGATGVGLVEVYDTNTASSAMLANISTRGAVKTGDNVMIGGFILGGSSTMPARVVVRAIGPSLAQSGVPNSLADPTLTLFNSNGEAIGSNDNWPDDAAQAAQLQALAIAPQSLAESAIVTTLPPGAYTAIVAGKSGGTGIGLIEVYYVQ